MNKPVAFEAVREPSSWLMFADMMSEHVSKGSSGFYAYTPLFWKFRYDVDGDGMNDSGMRFNWDYNFFRPRIHPQVPVGLADGHVEAVEFKELWETNVAGNVVHDFWWDDSCNLTP